MQDVQNQKDDRGIKIQHVGISNLYLPLTIENQQVLGKIRFTVALNDNVKGTHMSRFVEILQERDRIDMNSLEEILNEAREKLFTDSAEIKIEFKFFIEKTAPVSGKKSLLDLDCFFEARLQNEFEFKLGIEVPFTSLCPCSKEISEYGAHNQRSIARIVVQFEKNHCISIENLARIVELQGSQPIYSLLKREDEKFVTEGAFENPKFVEDILRDLVLQLRKIDGIKHFWIECENFESIHNHNAFARHEEFINR